MTKRDRQIILAAAVLLAQDAVALAQSHTVGGKWPKSERAAKRLYERMLDVSLGLCRMHNRRRRKAA